MVEGDIRPFGGFMTCGTVGPELTVVFIFRRVTSVTVFGRPLINIIHMAGCAGNGRMRANQRERGIGMIECRTFPRTRVVARTTVRSKLSHMFIFGGMARETIFWCAFVYAIDVTSRTQCCRMCTGKREGRL